MIFPSRDQIHLRHPRRRKAQGAPETLAGAPDQRLRAEAQRYVMTESASMLKCRVVAHQGDDEAIMRFEDKAVLRQVIGDTVLIEEIDAQDGIESHTQCD